VNVKAIFLTSIKLLDNLNVSNRDDRSFRVIKSVAAGLPVAADVGLLVPVNCAVPAILGDVSVGELASTKPPLPVSSVTAAARLAEVGVARKVAMPEPRPDTPVEIGSPVALVRVILLGVPAAPPLVINDPALPTFTAKAPVTPVPNAAPLRLGITTGLVNAMLAPAFKLLSAALAASELFVTRVTGMMVGN
jgi:hypothetical protein